MEFKTKNGHTVNLREELTAKQHRYLKGIAQKNMEFDPANETTTGLTGEVLNEIEDETIKAYVQAFNGAEDNAYENMMNTLTGDEYEEIWQQVNQMDQKKGKKSSS